MHSEEIGCEVWLPPMLFLGGWPIDCCLLLFPEIPVKRYYGSTVHLPAFGR